MEIAVEMEEGDVRSMMGASEQLRNPHQENHHHRRRDLASHNFQTALAENVVLAAGCYCCTAVALLKLEVQSVKVEMMHNPAAVDSCCFLVLVQAWTVFVGSCYYYWIVSHHVGPVVPVGYVSPLSRKQVAQDRAV